MIFANNTTSPRRGLVAMRDERGAITEIDHPDATPASGAPSPFGTAPFGINERGQIVGGFR
jgi:hypothetical protein